MKEFLLHEAKERFGLEQCFLTYEENISPDALSPDAWLENGTSYIWKIAVLGAIDFNKRDFANLLIGMERIQGVPQIIGQLNFPEGENDDCARTVQRIFNLIRKTDILFEKD